MSDTQRCEPPEHLRGVDGWHWVEAPSIKTQFVRRWWRARGEWCWADMDERTLRSFRYLAPVTPPATVAALVEALTECADDLEAEVAERYRATRHHPSERRREERDMAPVLAARAAIAKATGA